MVSFFSQYYEVLRVSKIIPGVHFNDSPIFHNSKSLSIIQVEPHSVKKQSQINKRMSKIITAQIKKKFIADSHT